MDVPIFGLSSVASVSFYLAFQSSILPKYIIQHPLIILPNKQIMSSHLTPIHTSLDVLPIQITYDGMKYCQNQYKIRYKRNHSLIKQTLMNNNPPNQSSLIANFNQKIIVQCFIDIHSPASSDQMRKQADSLLFEAEHNLALLMGILVNIFEHPESYNISIRFQALLLLSNIIKRNWNNKRLLKTHKQFPQVKKAIAKKIIQNIPNSNPTCINTLYEMTKFIAKADYPHTFPQFTQFQVVLMENMQIDGQFVKHFKQLKDIYLELGERKGFVNIKSFEDSLRRIVNGMGSLSEGFRGQIEKNNGAQNKDLCKLSKYTDQILISITRMAPQSLLDDSSFMMIPSHLVMKIQNLLTLHSEMVNKILEQKNIEKSIKSLIYGLGCLMTTNPCCIAQILQSYISILFSIISRPQNFHNPNTIKYSLISMRKLIKQFTYFAPDELFQKSVSSHPKSAGYLELRRIAHSVYQQFLKQETIQNFVNFFMTNVMNIRQKSDFCSSSSVTYGGLDEQNYANDASLEKQLSIHISAAMVVEAFIERFTEIMLKLIYNLLQECMDQSFRNVDLQTQINLFTVLSVIPKCCKKQVYREEYLCHFPILSVLQYIHSAGNIGNNRRNNNRFKQKFPALISGWLDIFSNEQINQLLTVLLDYISLGQSEEEGENMDLLLYSCFSLNKIVMLKSHVVDNQYILNSVFPIAIKIFTNTSNPQILWPLINLISSLITKCYFDTAMIVQSLEGASLQALINNDSELLIQALSQMFKNFLCVIPRDQPSLGIFQLIYHFLRTNLQKCLRSSSLSSMNFDKLVTLWYYCLREYPSAPLQQGLQVVKSNYLELFQKFYRKCLSFKKQPVLIFILEEYMLLDLIYNNRLEDFVTIVVEFYQEGDYAGNEVDSKDECLELKIAALSFQITLITKYKLEQVNSEQMLMLIMRDFCAGAMSEEKDGGRSTLAVSNTLQNSLLAIVNRYILLHPDYFFTFYLDKFSNGAGIESFYQFYFKNMSFLTSRTAIKINAFALISLLPIFPAMMQGSNMLSPFMFTIFQHILTEVSNQLTKNGQFNAGRVQNSPVFRFSQSVLSERKNQIRKQSFYDEINIRQFFIQKVQKLCQIMGGNLEQLASMLDQNDGGAGGYGKMLFKVYQG